MTDRILDISDRPARLTARGGLLVIDFSERSGCDAHESQPDRRAARDPVSGLRARATETQEIPFEDVAVLVTSHPQITFTQGVLAGLAAAGGMFIVSNEKHLPAAMMLPLSTHSTQTERFARQAAAPLPTRKRAWQQIVQAKLRAQAKMLAEVTGKDAGLTALAARVRSGDPDNSEAQGARIYWQALFAEAPGDALGAKFRRDPEGEGVNVLLNYGYAVLRAVVARALCASGLHPSLGVHHHNRYDTFSLADDLMEPFRPLVDRVVAQYYRDDIANLRSTPTTSADPVVPAPAGIQLDQNSKKAILSGLLVRYSAEGESRTLFDWASRSAASLAALIEGRAQNLSLPPLAPSSADTEVASS